MGAAGAVAGVVQAGAGLLGGGGGGGTQYVPNYSSMNEVQLASIDMMSRNYDAQSQLLSQSFQTSLGMQDSEYKQMIQQLVYDQEYQQQQLLSQAYQAQAATNVAETSLEMERLKQVYERGAKETATKMEFDNTMTQIGNQKLVRDLANAGTQEDFNRKLAEVQAQMGDSRQMRTLQTQGERLQRQELASQYQTLSIEDRNLLLNELKQQESLTGQLAELGKQQTGAVQQGAGIQTEASQQRQQLMSQFTEQARKQELGNANKLAQMSSSGLVNPDATIARMQMGQALNPIDQLKRELGLNSINTNEALGMAGVQANQAYLQQLEGAALRGDRLAQQELALAREQLGIKGQALDRQGQSLGLNEQQSALAFGTEQRGLQNQNASLMNAVYMDAIQNGLAPQLAEQLAMRQAEQNRNLTTGQMSVDSMLQDYGYDISKAGINYSRAQDAQSLADYQRMIASQGAANIQSAESAYLTGLMNQYAQNAANQSQLASGASAGINNAASNIRGTTYVDQPGSSGFNWSALGNLGKAGVGLFSSLSGMFGGGGSATSNAAVTQSYPEMSIPYSGRKDDYTYMPFPYSGSK